MSFVILGFPVLECVYMLACARWVCKRCLHTGTRESERWGLASTEDFEPVPRMCRLVLAVYEEDLDHPKWPPEGGYRIDPHCVIKRASYTDTLGRAPPYLIYLDHDHSDIVLAIRGLHLGQESDYAVLLNNKLGQEMFDGGFVHHGLLKSAAWLLDKESKVLAKLVLDYPSYTLTFAGHSLGSGVASMLAMLLAKYKDKLAHISRQRLRCYAIAPARCMSLNLAVRYADIIKSVVLQDDFLPRTATPLEDMFKCLFCLPCILCVRCIMDTCISEERMLQDPRRLYAPGRLYHIIERKLCRMGRFPPVVKTAIPVDGRFEHVVLSCNATSDHAIIWIERESQIALELMVENDPMDVPTPQKMDRQEILMEEQMEEHKAALERAVSLNVPHVLSSSYGTFDSYKSESDCEHDPLLDSGDSSCVSEGSNDGRSRARTNWEDLIDKLFEKDNFGKIVRNKLVLG